MKRKMGNARTGSVYVIDMCRSSRAFERCLKCGRASNALSLSLVGTFHTIVSIQFLDSLVKLNELLEGKMQIVTQNNREDKEMITESILFCFETTIVALSKRNVRESHFIFI